MIQKSTKAAATDSDGIGSRPFHMLQVTALWDELRAAIPPNLAKASDRFAFELLVVLVQRMRAGTLTASEAAQLRQLLESFALTPASRRKLCPEPGPFDHLMRLPDFAETP